MSENTGLLIFSVDKNESETKPEEETLYDVFSSGTIDKYTSDFNSVTDQDIGSILEEMSKLADTLSSNSTSECFNSKDSTKQKALQEKSLEELLEEAEQLVKSNTCCISQKILKSDVLDSIIFQRIEEEVYRESEKNKIDTGLVKSQSLKTQANKLSFGSEIDNLFNRDTEFQWFDSIKQTSLPTNNLKKELTDVDKHFFDGVLSNSIKYIEDKKPSDFNFKQEKCFFFDKPLQILPRDNENNSLNSNCILSDDLPESENLKTESKNIEIKNDLHYSMQLKEENNIPQSISCKKLTPRLELCVDSISQLISENSKIEYQDVLNEKIESFHKHTRKTPQKCCLTEMNPISTTKTKVVTICPTKSSKNEDRLNLKDKKSVSVSVKLNQINLKKCRSISEPNKNLRVVSSSRKSSKIVTQHKKVIPKMKVFVKNNSNLLYKVKLPLKSRKKDTSKNNSISKLISSSKTNQIMEKSTVSNWKSHFLKEEQTNDLLKKQIDLNEKFYNEQIQSVRSSFDKELFLLSKQNIALEDNMDEIAIKETKSMLSLKNNCQLQQLEKKRGDSNKLESFKTQEKKFLKNPKCLQNEIKNDQHKIKATVIYGLRPVDQIKKLQEEICKLNLELTECKDQNLNYLLQIDDIIQQNCLLKDELKMFKEQLREKNNFIAERLQTLTTTELKFVKQIEDLNVDLNTKTKSLKVATLNYEKLEKTLLLLEQELLEMRVKEGNLQETLEMARNRTEREKQLSLKLKNQVILDSSKIMDLTRQVREMERIVKRKNPDSVSALLLTANSEQDSLNTEKIQLLEIRNKSLENEMKAKEEKAQQRLADFRKEFAEMRKKYTIQIVDLEDKLLSTSAKEKENYINISTQTESSSDINKEANSYGEQFPSIQSNEKKEILKQTKVETLKLQSKKNDVHLVTTVSKLKLELSNKNKALSKLSKEFQELQKTNKRLQKEREKQLNDMRLVCKNTESNTKNNPSLIDSEKFLESQASEICYDNSNVSLKQCELRLREVTTLTPKLYNPLQYYENSESSMMKNLITENNILKEELCKMKTDFMALKNKRLRDLNLLQEEHERELTVLIQKYSASEKELNALKVQGKKSSQCIHSHNHLDLAITRFKDHNYQPSKSSLRLDSTNKLY